MLLGFGQGACTMPCPVLHSHDMANSHCTVWGDYNGVQAKILLDPTAPTSTISSSFAMRHQIPRSIRVVESVATSSASGPISVRTRHGWYQSSFGMRIDAFPSHDVRLGLDWFTACQTSFSGERSSTLAEPTALRNTVLSGGHRWVHTVSVPWAESVSVQATAASPSNIHSALSTNGPSPELAGGIPLVASGSSPSQSVDGALDVLDAVSRCWGSERVSRVCTAHHERDVLLARESCMRNVIPRMV